MGGRDRRPRKCRSIRARGRDRYTAGHERPAKRVDPPTCKFCSLRSEVNFPVASASARIASRRWNSKSMPGSPYEAITATEAQRASVQLHRPVYSTRDGDKRVLPEHHGAQLLGDIIVLIVPIAFPRTVKWLCTGCRMSSGTPHAPCRWRPMQPAADSFTFSEQPTSCNCILHARVTCRCLAAAKIPLLLQRRDDVDILSWATTAGAAHPISNTHKSRTAAFTNLLTAAGRA